MIFLFGSTRFVILCGPFAIKIARFRPIRAIIRLWQLLKTREVKRELQKYHKQPVLGGFAYLMAGVIANRTEYRRYIKYNHFQLVPTEFSFLGLLNVQRRGKQLTMHDRSALRAQALWQLSNGRTDDLRSARQFCSIGGRVCLADYASDIEDLLKRALCNDAGTDFDPHKLK